ncbi:MAG: hypothetical protein QM635_11125 [Microbacteriaceae bacterium]
MSERGAQRGRLRVILLAVTIPLTVFALVVAIWLVRPVLVEKRAIAEYERGDYAASEATSGSLVGEFMVEDWIPWFDRGAARAAQQDYVDAIDDFQRSLARVPASRECLVRLNLALAWETLGDEYLASGYPDGAEKLYDAGRKVIEAGSENCADDEELQQLHDEIEQRQDYAEQQAEGGDDSGDDSGEDEQDKLDQLDQKDSAGGQDKQDADSRDRGDEAGGEGSGSSGSGTDTPW